jgi:predicted DNA-binding transcriptional regulator AlpA
MDKVVQTRAWVEENDKWVKKSSLARDFGVSVRTIDRWRVDAAYGFPRAFNVGDRVFFLRSEINAWKSRVQATRKVA